MRNWVKQTYLNLLELEAILFASAHLYRVFRSDCNTSQSSTSDTQPGIICRADNLKVYYALINIGQSFIGIKKMLKTCKDYAMKHNILFSAKKIKCVFFITNLEYQLNQYSK